MIVPFSKTVLGILVSFFFLKNSKWYRNGTKLAIGRQCFRSLLDWNLLFWSIIESLGMLFDIDWFFLVWRFFSDHFEEWMNERKEILPPRVNVEQPRNILTWTNKKKTRLARGERKDTSSLKLKAGTIRKRIEYQLKCNDQWNKQRTDQYFEVIFFYFEQDTQKKFLFMPLFFFFLATDLAANK